MALRRSRVRRWLYAAAAAFGVLCILFAIIAVLIRPSVLTAQVKQRIIPQVEERLGRQIDVERISVHLFPRPHVALAEVEVAGRQPGEPPLLHAERVDAAIAVLPLLRSRGRDIDFSRVEVHRPEINLVRGKDGHWSFEGLAEGEGEGPSTDGAPQTQWGIDRFSLRDGRVQLIDRGSGPQEAVAVLDKLNVSANDVGSGLDRPMKVRLDAALASEKRNLELDLSGNPGNLSGLRGRLSLERAGLEGLLGSVLPAGLGEAITGGLVTLDVELGAGPMGTVIATGKARLDELRFHAEPADGRFDFVGKIDPEAPEATRVEVQNLALKGPGVELGGHASLQAQPTRVHFDLGGPLLDLETLLGAKPKPEKKPKEAKGTAAREVLLPEGLRRQIEAVRADGTLRIDRVVNGKLQATAVQAHAVLRDGVVVLESAKANLWQGSVDASGTRLNLAPEIPEWDLRARLQGIDMKKAMNELSAQPAPLEGTVDATVSLYGKGARWNQVASTLSGKGTMSFRDGRLTTTDLGSHLPGGLTKGLKTGRQTHFGRISTSFRVRRGWVDLEDPLSFDSPYGAVKLGGRVGLAKQLDLEGKVALSPSIVSKGLGVFRLGAPPPVQVPIAVRGTLENPSVSARAPKIQGRRILPKF